MITTNRNAQATGAIQLIARAEDGRKQFRELSPRDILVIGADPSCGMTLEGDDIASLHCMIKCDEGAIRIQDWNTGGGTFLNGRRIEQEAVVHPGSEFRIGAFRIRVEAASLPEADQPQSAKPEDAPDPRRSSGKRAPGPEGGESHVDTAEIEEDSVVGRKVESIAPERQPSDTEPGARASSSPASESDAARRLSEGGDSAERLEELRSENDGWRPEREQSQADAVEETQEGWFESDPFQQETIGLLRAEVEQLQQELAERDAQLSQLSMQDEPPSAIDEPAEQSSAETEALLGRLEQLLDELERADERVSTLEEIIHAADEANRAEQEERQQLEAWVGDIEQRIGQRESEWNAEREFLQRRVEEATAERDRAERAVDRAKSERGQSAADRELLEGLRGQITELQHKLSSVEQERDALEKQVAASDSSRLQERVDDAVREERAELAQERAALARQRAELTRLQENLEKSQQEDLEAGNNIDNRIRVFREHLRQIHEQEQQQRQKRSLSSRIARLWNRLEG